VLTWATFTDISLHGCYVEAMSTFRMGVKLGLTIEVSGFRVESHDERHILSRDEFFRMLRKSQNSGR
jgi:hypothetical protein